MSGGLRVWRARIRVVQITSEHISFGRCGFFTVLLERHRQRLQSLPCFPLFLLAPKPVFACHFLGLLSHLLLEYCILVGVYRWDSTVDVGISGC